LGGGNDIEKTVFWMGSSRLRSPAGGLLEEGYYVDQKCHLAVKVKLFLKITIINK
jgi:hypothetical protein